MDNKKIIEINGVKVEVDLREVKVVENYKVGDPVKILIKEYSSYKSYPGVIVGFNDFKKLPTMVIAYLETSYSSASIKFFHYNTHSEDVEICPSFDHEISDIESSTVLETIDREINSKTNELSELKNKRKYFIDNFNKHFQGGSHD